MNKIYLLCLNCLFFATTIPAQKMIDIDNRWNFYNPGDFSGYGRGVYTSFFKDSVEIEGKYYYRAYSTSDSTFQKVYPGSELYREENGVVYSRHENGNAEEMIYNFNLNVGDSIMYDFFPWPIKVLAIDSIELANKTKRKRLTMYTPNYPIKESNFRYWIEGIGGAFQTFQPSLMYASDGGSPLTCFFHKEEYVHGVYEDKCLEKLGPIIIDNTREIKTLTGVQILQNMGNGNISFRLEDPGHYQYRIYNTQGSLLQIQSASQGDHSASAVTFPKGMYLLQIYDLKNLRQKTFKFLNH